MARKAGTEKTGGRKKGTPNKVTGSLRDKMKEFALNNFNAFTDAFKEIEDEKEKCKIYLDACKYVMPALKSVEIEAGKELQNSIEDKLRELSIKG